MWVRVCVCLCGFVSACLPVLLCVSVADGLRIDCLEFDAHCWKALASLANQWLCYSVSSLSLTGHFWTWWPFRFPFRGAKGWRCSTKLNFSIRAIWLLQTEGPVKRHIIFIHALCVCVCVHQRPDEEVVVDQGGTSSVLNIHYEKEELEGE